MSMRVRSAFFDWTTASASDRLPFLNRPFEDGAVRCLQREIAGEPVPFLVGARRSGSVIRQLSIVRPLPFRRTAFPRNRIAPSAN